MSKKKVYASLEIADQEVRLVVLEIFEARYNVLRVERAECQGVSQSEIVDEAAVVRAIRTVITNAQAALGYRIERVLLAIPSIDVRRNAQKIHIQIEDGTRSIRLFHIQQGYAKAVEKKLADEVELVNVNQILYEVNGQVSEKLPLSQECTEFYMNVDLLYAKKETLYAYARCVEQANLEILDLCLDAYAIAEESAILVQSKDRPMIQLDVEKEHSTMAVFHQGKLMNAYSLELGYQWFIEPLQKKYDLSDATSFRLIQNIFATDTDSESIVYIEQKEEQRIEITASELTKSVLPRIRQWVAQINEACAPIVEKGNVRYVISGQGSCFPILEKLLDAFNAPASVYHSQSAGARDGSFVCGLGMAYAWNDINRIHRNDKISVNNNELEESIESIENRSTADEGGFTKKLKSVILMDKE